MVDRGDVEVLVGKQWLPVNGRIFQIVAHGDVGDHELTKSRIGNFIAENVRNPALNTASYAIRPFISSVTTHLSFRSWIQRTGPLQRRSDLFDLVCFDDVAGLNVIEVLQADTAFVPLLNLFRVVFESTE